MVVVVGGVMATRGDGSTVHKAKDHSHEYLIGSSLDTLLGELARDGEPDALKDACPVRERLH